MEEIKKYTAEEIKQIGERVRIQRNSENKSQRQLGDIVGVEKNVIQRLEGGRLKHVNIKLIYEIAYALQRNPDYFLLKTHNPRHPNYKVPIHYDLPEYQKEVEAFIYHNSRLRHDMEYIIEYMHPEIQEQLLAMIRSFVAFHKCGVHYPCEPNKAKKVTFRQMEKEIHDNFFKNYEEEEKRREQKRFCSKI